MFLAFLSRLQIMGNGAGKGANLGSISLENTEIHCLRV